MRTSRHRHGFTLVEMLISLAVTSIVLVGVIAAANAQQRAYYGGQKVRAAQNTARAALLYLEQKLPLAGFGMDPALALDLGDLGTWYTSGPCPSTPCKRDSTSTSDELVFYARNPAYWVHPTDSSRAPAGNAWRFTEITGTSVKILARANDVFRKGQILQAVCPGDGRYAYFTVKTRTPATGTVTTDGAVDVQLENAITTNPSSPFLRQDVATSASMGDKCFKPTTEADAVGRLFRIDRYRFHVRPVSQGGDTYDPYLVLDQGVDWNDDGVVDAKDEILVADGIEILQVGYVFADATNQTAGTTAGTQINWVTANDDKSSAAANDVPNTIVRTKFPGTTPPPSGQTVYGPSSFYRYRYDDPIRRSPHQANIRAIRIGLSARSPTPDTDAHATYRIATGFTLFNLDTPPTWIKAFADARGGDDRFQRIRLDSTVNLPNMLVRSIIDF